MKDDDFYPYCFRWDIAGRKGQRCRVFARAKALRGKLWNSRGELVDIDPKRWNSVGIEFPDGFKMITSGNALRKADPKKDQ